MNQPKPARSEGAAEQTEATSVRTAVPSLGVDVHARVWGRLPVDPRSCSCTELGCRAAT